MAQPLTYPIIVTEYHDEDGHYFVGTSPNIRGMVTQADTLAEMRVAAIDAIGTMLEGEPYPAPQDPSDWNLAANQRIVKVTIDMDAFLAGDYPY